MSSQSEKPVNTSVFDAESLCARMLGNKKLVKKILDGFFADIPGKVALLREQIESGSDNTAQRQAHAIKGAAANIGAHALSAIAREMELFGKAGDVETMRESLSDLEKALNELAKHPACKALRET